MFGKIKLPSSKQLPKDESVPNQKIIIKTKPIAKVPNMKYQKTRTKNQKISQIKTSLKGSKFRMLNQMLYTAPSHQAAQYFKEHAEDFDTYHQGFRQQCIKWSQNPLHSIITYLKKHYSNKNTLVLDLGCGDALLHQKISPYAKVRSFDLVAKKVFVEVADIANLPIDSHIADVCVFCLSLMGTNYIQFLYEAKRVLKKTGELLIAQVQSRCKQWDKFILMVESLGFSCKNSQTNTYFRLLYFTVNEENNRKLKIDGQVKQIKQYSTQILTGCLYKKR